MKGDGDERTAVAERCETYPAHKWVLGRELSFWVDVDISRLVEIRTRVKKKENNKSQVATAIQFISKILPG